MATGIDIPDPAARGQTDVPDPTGFLGGGVGLRCHGSIRCLIRNLRRQRRIAKEDVATIFETNPECLADEQRREAAAIDEQIARDLAGRRREHTLNVTRFGLIDLDDIRQHMPYTELPDAVPRKERSELA